MPLPERTYVLSLTADQVTSLGFAIAAENDVETVKNLAAHLLHKDCIATTGGHCAGHHPTAMLDRCCLKAIEIHRVTRHQIMKLLAAVQDDLRRG